MIPTIKLKIAGVMIWAWALVIVGACVQEERGTVIHKRPVEGMEGYKMFIREAQEPKKEVLIREAQEPEKRVYQVEGIPTQELNSHEAQASTEALATAKPQELPLELIPASEETSPGLRRQRIPLRRNRNLLLKQQSDSLNNLSD